MVHGILYLSYFSLGLIQLMASTHSEEQLTQLIYVSERKSDVDDAEVQSILETARLLFSSVRRPIEQHRKTYITGKK